MIDHFEATIVTADEVAGVLAWIDGLSQRYNLPKSAAFHLQLACDEWLTDAISYGFPDGNRPQIKVEIALKSASVQVDIIDNGIAFDPLARPAPDLDSPLESRKVGGLGIYFMRKVMNEVEYHRVDGHNHLKMVLDLSDGPKEESKRT